MFVGRIQQTKGADPGQGKPAPQGPLYGACTAHRQMGAADIRGGAAASSLIPPIDMMPAIARKDGAGLFHITCLCS